MDNIFKNWQDVLNNFKNSIDKELEEIRKCKREVQALKSMIIEENFGGYYLRDEKRIIISAPEIIIGNVDKSGELFSTGSTIIIRGGNLNLEGVGTGGTVMTRATSIRHLAVDPGSDGKENVVSPLSEIVSQARSITIQSNKDSDLFSSSIEKASVGGITLHADTHLKIDASVKAEKKKEEISISLKNLESQKTSLKKLVDSYRNSFDSSLKDIQDLQQRHDKLMDKEDDLRSNIGDVFEINDQLNAKAGDIANLFFQYAENISRLAEISRQINILKKQKDEVVTGNEYKNKWNGTLISISGEAIDIVSKDGEGNLSEDTGTGVSINANKIGLSALEKDSSLKPMGEINLNAMNIGISALDAKNLKADEKGNLKTGEFPASGDVVIKSKNLILESLDYELKDSKTEEKGLTKEGKLSMRYEKVDVSTNDSEGKATGSISFNSKNIDLKSMDIDKEKGTDKNINPGSSMLLLSEKMFIGGKDKDNESKLVQTASEAIGIFAKTTFEIQQGDKKSILQMDGGKMALSGDKTEIFGKTTVNNTAEVKGELKAPKATIDNVEAKSSFKSPNISDGIAVGGGGGGSNLSAKLEKENLKKE